MKKFTVYPKSVKSSISAASRTNQKYIIEYYLNTCAAERRPTTVEDVESDYMIAELSLASDLEAFQYAAGLASGYDISEISDPDNFEDIQSEYEDIESCKDSLEYADPGDGSVFVCKIYKGSEILFDFGIDKDYLLEEAGDGYDDEDWDEDEDW